PKGWLFIFNLNYIVAVNILVIAKIPKIVFIYNALNRILIINKRFYIGNIIEAMDSRYLAII
nr:hypothetical protein [Escherichia coli]